MRATVTVTYSPALSILALFLSSGALVDNSNCVDADALPLTGTSSSSKTKRRRTSSRHDSVDDSSYCRRGEGLSDLIPFIQYYPCRGDERVRLSCGVGCFCVAAFVNGSSGVCAPCHTLRELADSTGVQFCDRDPDKSIPLDLRHPAAPETRNRVLEDPVAQSSGGQRGAESEATPAPAPPSSPSAASNAPSPYPTFISYVPSTSWTPTTTHRPTNTWYPSHTWRPSVTWYPSHSQRPSASPTSQGDGGNGGGDGTNNNPPSAPAPSAPSDESPSATKPASASPPSSKGSDSSSASSGKAPSLPGQAAFGLIVVAAILIAVVYVVWSRSSAGNRRRNRRQELRHELELTDTGRNGDLHAPYDYHDRTGSYDPNELI